MKQQKTYPPEHCFIGSAESEYLYTYSDPQFYANVASIPQYRGSASYWREGDSQNKDVVCYFISGDMIDKTCTEIEKKIAQKVLNSDVYCEEGIWYQQE